MAFSTQADDDGILSEINITPLVDVMLVLLVAFIVTAPLLNNAVQVNLPKTAATRPPAAVKPLNLSIDVDAKLYLERTPISLESLETTLTEQRHKNPDLALHLQADAAVAYRYVAQAMAAIERAGVSKLAIITNSQ